MTGVSHFMGADISEFSEIMGADTLNEIRQLMGAEFHVFRDEFEDTDGTALLSHSPDVDISGSEWTIGTNWEIRTNRLNELASSSFAAFDIGEADMAVVTKLVSPSIAALRVNRAASNNYWDIIADNSGNTLTIWQYTGSWHNRAQDTVTLADGDILIAVTNDDDIWAAVYSSAGTLKANVHYNTTNRAGKTGTGFGISNYSSTDWEYYRASLCARDPS